MLPDELLEAIETCPVCYMAYDWLSRMEATVLWGLIG